MATEKSKGGGNVTWWKHLLHKLDPSASNSSIPVPASSGSTLVGSVTSSVEAFADSGTSVTVCQHHKEGQQDQVNGNMKRSSICSCPSCPCANGQTNDLSVGGKGDPSVVDMIRSLDAFANKRIIDPSQDHWIESLNKLMTDFYLNSTSTNVRLRALEILSMCLHDFSYIHEDLVIESIVIKVIN